MKTIQIISEQIRSAESLARAFTEEQWRAIVDYFRKKRNLPPLTERRVSQFLSTCGSDMIESGEASSHTPSSWNRDAARYGVAAEVSVLPTWNQIYEHLLQAKDHPAPPPDLDIGGANSFTRYDDTPETMDDIRNLVTDNTLDSFPNFATQNEDGYDQSGRLYLSKLLAASFERRNDDQISFFQNETIAGTDGSRIGTRPMQSWKRMTQRLQQIVTTNGQVTKEEIDLNFFSWLKTWDTAWQKHQRDNL